MSDSKSTYIYDGKIGNVAKTVVTGITTQAAAETFKAFLEAHTDAEINGFSFSSRVVTDNVPAEGSNTDLRGEAYFQNTVTGGTVPVTLPAIKSTDCEDVPGREGGKRLTDTFMGLLKTALETATGKSFRILYGYVVQKK